MIEFGILMTVAGKS